LSDVDDEEAAADKAKKRRWKEAGVDDEENEGSGKGCIIILLSVIVVIIIGVICYLAFLFLMTEPIPEVLPEVLPETEEEPVDPLVCILEDPVDLGAIEPTHVWDTSNQIVIGAPVHGWATGECGDLNPAELDGDKIWETEYDAETGLPIGPERTITSEFSPKQVVAIYPNTGKCDVQQSESTIYLEDEIEVERAVVTTTHHEDCDIVYTELPDKYSYEWIPGSN